jgi:class 3 adenylate cyclase
MLTCHACSTENPDLARFCMECGTPLDQAPAAAAGSRRVVTILFTDIVGSTELGERLDPETLRAVLTEYFATMKAAVERHGGTVEKFIGDAIMAVFGLAAIHEDDALRAARAAVAMREALVALNVELQGRRGISLTTRTGLFTGAVMAGDPALRQTMVTGDAVNTAARLEQAAGPGEILLGLSTWQLVRQAVTVEPVQPVAAKGKAEPIEAVRLISVADAGRQRASGTPALVGRDAELADLEAAFETVVTSRRPLVRFVVGPAGVGKSRLVEELVAHAGDRATVRRGHCLAYGDGITYWPIREILLAAAGIQDRDAPAEGIQRLADLVGGVPERDTIAARLATAIGLGNAAYAQEEIFWAIRRTIEQLAEAGPLVLILEDIHWAEPALLELIGHIVQHAADVPLLLVCPARPEALERLSLAVLESARSATIRLEGLEPAATASLIDAIPGGATIPAELRTRILATVEGNPLFLEEMVRMVVEASGGPGGQTGNVRRPAADVVLPPTIQALLAARVDQLPGAQRDVAKRASVVGRKFEPPAVEALSAAEARPGITASLLGLVQREVVTPAGSELNLAEAYQFRHVLLRDAAYEALSKTERADLHRRFADWLEVIAADRLLEYEEILGYHLAQAYRYRVELRENDAQTVAIGGRAAGHLAAAGKRALDRGEGPGSVRLLEQAAALPAGAGVAREELLLTLGRALQLAGRNAEATARAEEALALAGSSGNRRIAARARLLRLEQARTSRAVRLFDPTIRSEAALALADAEASGDNLALAEAHDALGGTEFYEGNGPEYEARLRRARDYATAAGEPAFALSIGLNLVIGAWMSPRPLTEVLAEVTAHAARAAAYPVLHAEALSLVGRLTSQLGDPETGEALINEAIDVLIELGSSSSLPHMRTYLAQVRWVAGDAAGAEAAFRQAMAEAQVDDDLFFISFASAHLGMLLVDLERYDEATAALDEGELATNAITRSRMLGARARILATRGDPGARALINESLAMTSGWAWPMTRAEGLLNAARVDRLLGDREAAELQAREALALTRSKGEVPYSATIERFLATLAADE